MCIDILGRNGKKSAGLHADRPAQHITLREAVL